MIRYLIVLVPMLIGLAGRAWGSDDPDRKAQMRAALKGMRKVQVIVRLNPEATKLAATNIVTAKDVQALVTSDLRTAGLQVGDDNPDALVRVYVTLVASPVVVGAYGVRAEVGVMPRVAVPLAPVAYQPVDVWWAVKSDADSATTPQSVRNVLLTAILDRVILPELVLDWKLANATP